MNEIDSVEKLGVMNEVGWIFGIAGVVFIIIAVIVFFHTLNFIRNSVVTEGTVIDVVRDDHTYYPRIRFETYSGEIIEFKAKTGASPPSYEWHDMVEIRYNPKNPYKARINGFFSLWGISAIPGLIGLVFSAMGLFCISHVRRINWLRQHGKIISTE